jgi:hypothetical protein
MIRVYRFAFSILLAVSAHAAHAKVAADADLANLANGFTRFSHRLIDGHLVSPTIFRDRQRLGLQAAVRSLPRR